MIDQRTNDSKSRAVETVEKHNCRFSTVPTAPTAADKSRYKAADPKQQTIVYTKSLADPQHPQFLSGSHF